MESGEWIVKSVGEFRVVSGGECGECRVVERVLERREQSTEWSGECIVGLRVESGEC